MTMILELTAPSQNESSIASPKVVRVLPVLRALFESLGRAGVRYCHWKSNWRLPETLRGETDLDLLVHRADTSRFLAVVGALRLKPGSGEDQEVAVSAEGDRLPHAPEVEHEVLERRMAADRARKPRQRDVLGGGNRQATLGTLAQDLFQECRLAAPRAAGDFDDHR